MRTKRIRYLLAAMPGFILEFPFTVNDWFSARFFSGESRNGIRIIDLDEDALKEFIDTISCALDLIRKWDVRRFKRVTREIRVINHIPAFYYARPMRMKTIDLRPHKKLTEISDEYAIKVLACLLISSATFASFHTRGILPNRRNRDKIGRICSKETVRFARKIGLDDITCEILGDDYEPSTFSERLKEAVEGIRYLYRKQDS